MAKRLPVGDDELLREASAATLLARQCPSEPGGSLAARYMQDLLLQHEVSINEFRRVRTSRQRETAGLVINDVSALQNRWSFLDFRPMNAATFG